MLNKAMIIGRLGRDPELRYTQSGTAVTTLNIATDDSFVDREGQRQERTEWHRVVVFQRQAENCSQYLGKGSLVYVEGKITTRKWQDQSGQDRYTTEIRAERVQFLDRKGDRQAFGSEGEPPVARRQPPTQPKVSSQNEYEDFGPAFPSEASSMDDIPF